MKKSIVLFMAALLTVLPLTACSGSKDSASSSAPKQGTSENAMASDEGTGNSTENLADFDLVLDWYPNAIHAFIYDAIDKGYFADEGLKVNILFPANSNDAISLTAAGRADAGLYYQNDIIIARANENVPVVSIGSVVKDSLDIIASLSEKGINRPKDLEGKKLGYTATEFGDAVIRKMLENDGASLDSVKLINVGLDLMRSMTTGNVGATFGCFVNHEIPQLEKEGFDMNYFKLSDYGIPNYYALVFVAGEKNVNNNYEKYHRFLKACLRGFYDMKTDPEGTLDILLKYQNEENFPLDPDVEKKSLDVLLPMMEKEFLPFLAQDANVFQENINWLYDNGLIESKIEPQEIMYDAIDQDYDDYLNGYADSATKEGVQ